MVVRRGEEGWKGSGERGGLGKERGEHGGKGEGFQGVLESFLFFFRGLKLKS